MCLRVYMYECLTVCVLMDFLEIGINVEFEKKKLYRGISVKAAATWNRVSTYASRGNNLRTMSDLLQKTIPCECFISAREFI